MFWGYRVRVSVLLHEGPASLPARGAELEEGLGSVGLQAGEEPAVPVVARGDELRASLGSCMPSRPWVTRRRLTDVSYWYTELNVRT